MEIWAVEEFSLACLWKRPFRRQWHELHGQHERLQAKEGKKRRPLEASTPWVQELLPRVAKLELVNANSDRHGYTWHDWDARGPMPCFLTRNEFSPAHYRQQTKPACAHRPLPSHHFQEDGASSEKVACCLNEYAAFDYELLQRFSGKLKAHAHSIFQERTDSVDVDALYWYWERLSGAVLRRT